jgi:hypothetical protein
MQTNEIRASNKKRAYHRLLRGFLSERLEASYKENQARPLPPRLRDLLKKFEYRSPYPGQGTTALRS